MSQHRRLLSRHSCAFCAAQADSHAVVSGYKSNKFNWLENSSDFFSVILYLKCL